jgi:hypothetical protein
MKKRNSLALLALLAGLSTQAAVINEWTFETESANVRLGSAVNSGFNLAAFTGSDSVTKTDGSGGLTFANNISETGNFWTDGAILSAAVTNQTGGVRYLRYDVDYDMTSESNDGGTLIGLSFTDEANSDLAGFALKYDVGTEATMPTDYTETTLESDLELSGSIAVLAKVDLDNGTLEVWYNLSGDNSFNASNYPNVTVTNLSLSSINELEFRATGDFISTSAAVVDNIRTATTWDEIINPLADSSRTPEPTIVSVTDQLDGIMAVEQTNLLTVVIQSIYGSVEDMTSSLDTGASAGDFTIISNNTAVSQVGVNGLVTNYYQVIPHTQGNYTLSLQGKAGSLTGPAVEFELLVGEEVRFLSYGVANETNGVIAGYIEPGESFDLTITNINSGAITVSNVNNSLTANNPTYFPSISAPSGSQVYGTMVRGDTTSTTYRVTCAASTPAGTYTFTVDNSTDLGSWTDTFELEVFKSSIIDISTNALAITVIPGETVSTNLTLSNIGNDSDDYSVYFGGQAPSTGYTVQTTTVQRADFSYSEYHPETVFTNWSGTATASKDIGFDFYLFGSPYSTFSVDQYGTLTLSGEHITATSTNSTTASLYVFAAENGAEISTNTIRYSQSDDRLIVAWGHTDMYAADEDLEFQVWINADGTVQYLYEAGTWDSGTIAMTGTVSVAETDTSETVSETITHTPGTTGADCLLLTPASWFTCDPTSGNLLEQDSQVLTFTAAPDVDVTEGIYYFAAQVTLGDTVETVDLTVTVESPTVALSVPSSVSFSGLAGIISRETMTIENEGNVQIDYVIMDQGQYDGSYYPTPIEYTGSWKPIPIITDYILDESDLGAALPIGFPFTYAGRTFTEVTVYEAGYLMLADEWDYEYIMPFYGDVSFDSDAQIRMKTDNGLTYCSITWDDMALDDGGENNTFQVVLFREDGVIRFNYKRLGDGWENTSIGLTNEYGELSVDGSEAFYNDDNRTISYEEVITYEMVTNSFNFIKKVPVATNYTETIEYEDFVAEQSLEFHLGLSPVLSASPMSGTLDVGESTEITVIADARSISDGGTETLTIDTTLNFYVDSHESLEQNLASSTDSLSWTSAGTVDGTTTLEYYLVGTPYMLKPEMVLMDGELSTEGTAGALADGGWAWGDINSLGYNTIYVQLSSSDGRDPDTSDVTVSIRPYSGGLETVDVSFTAKYSSDSYFPTAAETVEADASMWGTDDVAEITVTDNDDGSRAITWPAPDDTLSRTYTVWATTSLTGTWTEIGTVENGYTYTDKLYSDEPVVFFKVTVE